MAELCIRIEYKDPLKERMLSILRLCFPFWTLLPIGYAIFYGANAFSVGGISEFQFFQRVTVIVTAMLIPFIALSIIKYLSHNQLLIDKGGIEIPPDFSSMRLKSSYLAWCDVDKILVADNGKDKTINLIARSGSVLPLNSSAMDATQLEKLLVTIDLMVDLPKDESLIQLASAVKAQLAGNQVMLEGPSYTDIWEDELKRRFRPAAFMPLEKGLVLRNGTITIFRQLALGGLSAVYLGSMQNGKLVVIKESVVPPDYDGEIKDKAREMFEREAKILIQLSHPSIVQVMDFFVEQERSYLMLDHVLGVDLKQHVKQNGPLRQSQVINLAGQMTDILHYLHSQEPPVIHRDFTPDNLVLTDGDKVIAIDFGAANEFIGNATGTFVGKHSYIAPEQFRGKASPQSDLYAMGGTLYFLLTGQDPEALSVSDPGLKATVAEPLRDLIKGLTSVNTKDRISSAGELKEKISGLEMIV
ncbi:MAG: serine/threonine protein kinase [Candidatus Obscuribacter sp.]|nr:serine/threonine protein kinase [Candidatus Obscuribacter sp.]